MTKREDLERWLADTAWASDYTVGDDAVRYSPGPPEQIEDVTAGDRYFPGVAGQSILDDIEHIHRVESGPPWVFIEARAWREATVCDLPPVADITISGPGDDLYQYLSTYWAERIHDDYTPVTEPLPDQPGLNGNLPVTGVMEGFAHLLDMTRAVREVLPSAGEWWYTEEGGPYPSEAAAVAAYASVTGVPLPDSALEQFDDALGPVDDVGDAVERAVQRVCGPRVDLGPAPTFSERSSRRRRNPATRP
jgi:hypothetical protein